MPDDFQSERMRALRRDTYSCQVRMPDGSRCGRRTATVTYRDAAAPATADNLTATCRDH